MLRRKKKTIILIALSIILLSFLIYYFINQHTSKSDNTQYDTSFYDNESIVYLGEETSVNEVLFIFDYSCIWCSRWLNEIFPTIEQFIHEGKVKFRTQSMVFINNASLELSKLDQNIKMRYPDKYFEILLEITADGFEEDLEQLLDANYIEELIANHQLDSDIALAEPILDVSNLTKRYANKFDIESVPTIIVNGRKVKDPFSLEEIESLFK